MSAEQNLTDPRIHQAVEELTNIIRARWPSAGIEVMRAVDDPEAIHLNATVDIEDTEDVIDAVINRVLELQLDEGLPIHVIPVRPPERTLEELRAERAIRTPRRW